MMAWKGSKIEAHSKVVDTFDMGVDTGLVMNNKLDNILNLLHSIDDRLRSDNSRKGGDVTSPPPTIPLPPIPGYLPLDMDSKPTRPPPTPHQKPLPSPPIEAFTKIGTAFPDSPPPIPPKHLDAIHPLANKDGSITFTASQCLCLTLQLKAVRMFIDENFEDEHVDKELNINCLDSAIRTLSGLKK